MQYVITGIGTGVGKTLVSAALCHQSPGLRAIKPVLSGFDPAAPQAGDAGQLLAAMGEPCSEAALDAVSPWRFAAPLSPHLAAAREGRVIDPVELTAFCQRALSQQPRLLIEGVGGLMVPLRPDWLVLDWLETLRLPVVLVGASYLGAINHTLLSLSALRAHGLRLHALIISQSEAACCAGAEDTASSIRPFLPEGAQMLCLPRVPDRPAQEAWKAAPDLLSLMT